ncbi:carbohydrate ABC transporter permease [Roseomonas elaeocarpi]|uniref:Maltose/maltodextrin transport system permease protein MalG n=1 Tax=Roseomonas elaeocarpi TaxID=907779 RepID=A0ABV6JM82_9PROT
MTGRTTFSAFAYYATAGTITLIFLFPVAWVAFASFQPSAGASALPGWLPSSFTLANYAGLLSGTTGFWRYLWNSLVVAAGSAVGVALIATPAAYGFTRFSFFGRRLAFVLTLVAIMVPFQTVLTPLFLVLRILGLQNSLFGLGIVYTTFHLPLGILIMMAALQGVPRALDEAATIDGASEMDILLRVLLPLIRPSLVTVVLVNFISSWNEFLAALILMTDQSNYTMPVMLVTISFGYLGAVDWGALQAGTVLTILPCLVLTAAFQRYYVQGLLAGSTKG